MARLPLNARHIVIPGKDGKQGDSNMTKRGAGKAAERAYGGGNGSQGGFVSQGVGRGNRTGKSRHGNPVGVYAYAPYGMCRLRTDEKLRVVVKNSR
jgi:hypothetical protein